VDWRERKKQERVSESWRDKSKENSVPALESSNAFQMPFLWRRLLTGLSNRYFEFCSLVTILSDIFYKELADSSHLTFAFSSLILSNNLQLFISQWNCFTRRKKKYCGRLVIVC